MRINNDIIDYQLVPAVNARDMMDDLHLEPWGAPVLVPEITLNGKTYRNTLIQALVAYEKYPE